MRTFVSLLAASAAVLGGALAGPSAPAAAATSPLKFLGTQYDSPGTDTRTATSLNGEWIALVNTGPTAIDLRRYRVYDPQGHLYTFTAGKIAGQGGRIYLHTGSGRADATNFFWGSSAHVWNNTGDTATLTAPGGLPIDTCTWVNVPGRTWVGC
ncbi:lamin tail domain-containing protein [Micromonosporaceae bacterium Da 78-11]